MGSISAPSEYVLGDEQPTSVAVLPSRYYPYGSSDEPQTLWSSLDPFVTDVAAHFDYAALIPTFLPSIDPFVPEPIGNNVIPMDAIGDYLRSRLPTQIDPAVTLEIADAVQQMIETDPAYSGEAVDRVVPMEEIADYLRFWMAGAKDDALETASLATLYMRFGGYTPEALYRNLVAAGYTKEEARDMSRTTPDVGVRVTIDDYPGLRENLDITAITDITRQIDKWYILYPFDTASAAVHDLLQTTLDNLRPPILPYESPIDPLQDIDLQITPPGMMVPPGPDEELLPPGDGVEPAGPAMMAPEDEGSLLPLGIGALAYVLAAV